jgi:hypothetical protein
MTEPELDIVEELRFFAEACDADGITVAMLSGRTFTDAADEIERLRSLIIKWTDADGAPSPVYDAARTALRKAVGR